MTNSRVPTSLLCDTYSVFIGHIHPDTTKAELREVFQGCVDSVIVPSSSSCTYNFGFARYVDAASMFRAAKELNRWSLHGTPLVVDVSKDTIMKLQAEKAAGKVIDTGMSSANAGKNDSKAVGSKPDLSRFNNHLQDTMYLSRVKENCTSVNILDDKGNFMRTTKLLLEDIDQSQNTRSMTCFGRLHEPATGFQHVSEQIMTRCKMVGEEGEVFGRRKSDEFKFALKVIMTEIGEFLSQEDEFHETDSDVKTVADSRHESEDVLDKDDVSFHPAVEAESKGSVTDNQTDGIEPVNSISDEQIEMIIKQLKIRMKEKQNEQVVKGSERNEFVESEKLDAISEAEKTNAALMMEQHEDGWETEKEQDLIARNYNSVLEVNKINDSVEKKSGDVLDDEMRTDPVKLSVTAGSVDKHVGSQTIKETLKDMYTRAYMENENKADLFQGREISDGSHRISNLGSDKKSDLFEDSVPFINSDMTVKDDMTSNSDSSECKADTSFGMEDSVADFDPAILDFHTSAKFDSIEDKVPDCNSLDSLFRNIGSIPRSSSHDSSLSDDSSKGIIEDSGVESDFLGAFTNRRSAGKLFAREHYDNPPHGHDEVCNTRPSASPSSFPETENIPRWNKAATLSITVPNRGRLMCVRSPIRDVKLPLENDPEKAHGRGMTLDVDSSRQVKRTLLNVGIPKGRGRGLLMAFSLKRQREGFIDGF